MSKIGLWLLPLLLVGTARATNARPKNAQPPQLHYDFDDDVVEGGALQPDGALVESRRVSKQSSLIKIRETFLPELLKSAEDR